MKPSDRTKLTNALRGHVAQIAADLRTKMRGLAPGSAVTRDRALKLHADERVGQDFEAWTDLLSRRAAVLWILKSVYVRVLEDRGLLSPGRLLDAEAQQLFEKLAPNLGETAFLRWIYRDLASRHGGLPELFSPQPAEVALPSDLLSRKLIEFWRHRDADTGGTWSFAEELFEGELMGDLYQELDPVVKDRYALCQTPDFVRAFILDRTLTPAIEEFGADVVRLLDPACGSGHFLIDGMKRLVAATGVQHPDWSPGDVVRHVLDRVVGMDLNDYACALARTRMLMTAAQLAGATTLAAAAEFQPHVYWADALEQVERDEGVGLQVSIFDDGSPRATFTRADVRGCLRKLFERNFHAVVGNPPYIAERDEGRKTYHREKVAGRQRYASAYAEYSLVGPFIERCLQLATTAAWIGLLVGNSFTKKPTGRPLVEEVLALTDLFLVADTSQANLPHHGTPTVVLFIRNQPPTADSVPVVISKRADPSGPDPNGRTRTWFSIVRSCESDTFEDEFVARVAIARKEIAKHPWAFGASATTELKSVIEAHSTGTLAQAGASIGRTTVCGADPVYALDAGQARRRSVGDLVAPMVIGEAVRDWSISQTEPVLYPYVELGGAPIPEEHAAIRAHFWPFRTLLRARTIFGRTIQERRIPWYEHIEHYRDRLRGSFAIAHTFVSTHNHFALAPRGLLFKKTAPAITLDANASAADYHLLLGVLNSSTVCFWLKQVLHPKGATSANRNHPDPERAAFEFTATALEAIPVPSVGRHRAELVRLSVRLDRVAKERTRALEASAWSGSLSSLAALKEALAERWRRHDELRQRMVFLQEEIDWLVYHLFGLTSEWLASPQGGEERLPRGARPFERVHGHRSFVRERGDGVPPALAECDEASPTVPEAYDAIIQRRVQETSDNPRVAIIEQHMFKRMWRDTEDNVREGEFRRRHDTAQLREWLADGLERAACRRTQAFEVGRLVADMMEDAEFQVVAEAHAGSSDFSLANVVLSFVANQAVPSHPSHVYTVSGLAKRQAWEHVWDVQRREDAGDAVEPAPMPPEYSQGSRGKPTDFLRAEYWKLRGRLDVPKEQFIAFTEIPGRSGPETLYGWAGWTPLQRLKALLAIDEDLEDAGTPLGERIGVLDSAWRLLPDVARDDPAAAARLRAELQAVVGPTGPSREMLEDWKKRFPPPTARASRGRKATKRRAAEKKDSED